MNKTEALKALAAAGTAQNRKVYARHGVGSEMFGVSYANLGKLRKQIKVDHELATELWATGNHDARVLATMIADPARLTAATLDAWAADCSDHVIGAAFAGLAAQSPHAKKRLAKWTKSKDEWLGALGWSMLAAMTAVPDALSDEELAPYIGEIERRIHASKNRTRYSMNSALIAIGSRGGALQRDAVAAAKRIGKVEVDHGETGCKTPDAASYIEKTVAHQRTKAGKASKKGKAGKTARAAR